MKIVPIVEGRGEVDAVPVLLRRLAAMLGVAIDVHRPIRTSRSSVVKQGELQRVVQLAAMRTPDPGDAILVLLDADEDCAARLGPQLLAWAVTARADRPLAVVIAVREFEAWFVAAAESLVAAGKLAPGSTAPQEPEAIRDAKGWLAQRMPGGYSPTIHQAKLAAQFDLSAARTCSSFDKFVRDVERMIAPR